MKPSDFITKHLNAIVVFILLTAGIFYESSAYIPTYVRYLTGGDINLTESGTLTPKVFEVRRQTTPYKNITLHMNFRLNEYGGNQGLFQTADYNTGVRFEIGPDGKAALLVGRADGVYQPYEIPKIELNKDYTLQLKVSSQNIVLSLNNVRVVDAAVATDEANIMKGMLTNFEVTQVKIGAGFDDTRIFKGSIKDFSIWYTATEYIPIMHHVMACIIVICLLLLTWQLFNSKHVNRNTGTAHSKTVFVPLLFAAYPVLFHYAHNIKQTSIAISLNDIWVPLGWALGITLITMLIFYAFTRDKEKSVILSSFSVLGFAIAGHVHALLGGNIPESLFLFELFVVIFCTALFLQNNTQRASKVNDICLVVAGALTLMVSIDIGSTTFHQLNSSNNTSDLAVNSTQPPTKGNQPDIYIILADGYANNDTLKEEYGFDNSAFLNTLKEKGFVLPRHYHSNYNETRLSVPSFLNMDYHPLDKYSDNTYLAHVYQNAAAIKFLKGMGYTFYYINPAAAVSQTHDLADVQNPCTPDVTDFFTTLLDTTALFAYNHGKGDDGLRALTECGTQSFMDTLKKTAAPKFVFYHFFKPHYPYVYNADGGKVDPHLQFAQQSYVGQMQYASGVLLKLVDAIKSTASHDPIIILLSDHGSLISGKGKEHYFDIPDDPSDPRGSDKFNSPKALAAFYLPGKSEKTFGDELSAVNILRLIFNDYFGTSFKRLPDKSTVSTNIKDLEFVEVTDMLKKSWLDLQPQ